MNDLRLWANYYYNMGFNVTHINAKSNQSAKNPYKSATNDRFSIQNRRQELSELQSFDWENSNGIGAVLGFNNLRALDFDFYDNGVASIYPLQEWEVDKPFYKNNETFIAKTLSLLGLPEEYEWVIKTPSGGFHIIVYSSFHKFPIRDDRTKAFIPNELTYSRTGLKQIELRWSKHLVLPPSNSATNENYCFKNKIIPKSYPLEITMKNIDDLLMEYSYQEYETGNPFSSTGDFKSGYNLYYSTPYINKDEEAIKYYEDGEYLDLTPVYLEKGLEIKKIPQDWIK
mgnify:CR=1 FL=1